MFGGESIRQRNLVRKKIVSAIACCDTAPEPDRRRGWPVGGLTDETKERVSTFNRSQLIYTSRESLPSLLNADNPLSPVSHSRPPYERKSLLPAHPFYPGHRRIKERKRLEKRSRFLFCLRAEHFPPTDPEGLMKLVELADSEPQRK
ncbi:Hypothetical protein NTJ_03921 [Nesidiocoris tenuis]|uniref:Uncharacterized protein n=1 Tax=Nesidiocoris tenuis TaxID=355587 RepID=A0ABN7AGD3_9HEMI|nr:Hypothetical protein NTJ_03921 [Nesidiocoris tenuis]